jgi:hypothetical protein
MKYILTITLSLMIVFGFHAKAHAIWNYANGSISYVVTGPLTLAVNLVANPTSVATGGTSMLTVTASNFSVTPTCSIDQGVGSVTMSVVGPTSWTGSKSSLGIANTTTFTATCTQGVQTASGTAIVTTTAAPVLDVTLSASPNPVASSGNSSTLTWTVTSSGAVTSCTASNGWSGSKSVGGGSQSSGPITGPTTFTISCTGAAGSDVDSVIVTVNSVAPPVIHGSCSTPPTHYSCDTGTSTNNTEDVNAWMWVCSGSGGGSSTSCSETKGGGGGPVTACNDGIDNDGDTKIDMLDQGCSSPADNDETNAKPIFIEF